MHRLRSTAAIFRFRLAAVLTCCNFLLFPLAAGMMIYSLVTNNLAVTKIAAGLTAIAAGALILHWLTAQRTNCPLCITPVLANKRCSKNRNAKTLFGSHRLRVAVSILFRNCFRCPYCNEPTAIELRQRNQAGYSKD